MEKRLESFLSQIKSSTSSLPVRLPLVAGILGVSLILIGVFVVSKNSASSNVEVLQTPDTGLSTKKTETGNIVVDISGAVQKPGVYRLSAGDRVEDSITAAGGLAANADKSWVDKNLNLAAKLIDGQKLYIPSNQQSNVLGASNSSTGSNVAQSDNTLDSGKVNINTASLTDLESLDGIGPKYAQNIVDHRPYSDVNELTSNKVIPSSAFNKIQDKISVY